MTSYAFWNNKGGVGKSFLAFTTAAEFAHIHPETDVYVIDLCPQANVSETFLGGGVTGAKAIRELTAKRPRATISGYLEARLNSPFTKLPDVRDFVTNPASYNRNIPSNLRLVCGDNLLEIQSEAIRQTSALAVPNDAWKQVLFWVNDLVGKLKLYSGDRDTLFIIDCNPSFAIFTQLAVLAADHIIVPFTADDASRRGVENIVALVYGIGDEDIRTYAKINFSERAKEEGIETPKLHTFISNRVTRYRGRPSSAFQAVINTMVKTMDDIHAHHRSIFSQPRGKPSENFVSIPDYHSACIVSSSMGKPLHKIKPGPHKLPGEVVQLNPDPLAEYRNALGAIVERF